MENREAALCEAGVGPRVRARGHFREEDWLVSGGWRRIEIGGVSSWKAIFRKALRVGRGHNVLSGDSTKFSKLSKRVCRWLEFVRIIGGAGGLWELTFQIAQTALIIHRVSYLTQTTCWPHFQEIWFVRGLSLHQSTYQGQAAPPTALHASWVQCRPPSSCEPTSHSDCPTMSPSKCRKRRVHMMHVWEMQATSRSKKIHITSWGKTKWLWFLKVSDKTLRSMWML